MAERDENGPFPGLEEFCRRMAGKELNRRAVESLIRAGAFDSLAFKRKALMQVVDRVMEGVACDGKRNIDGQLDLFDMGGRNRVRTRESLCRTFRNFPAGSLWRWKRRSRGFI